MSEIAPLRLFNRVVVDFNDLVQVVDNDLSDFMESAEVIFAARYIHECGESQRGKIAHGNFVWGGIFDNLSTEIRASNSAKVLLITLLVASIFVEYVRVTSLGLSLEY